MGSLYEWYLAGYDLVVERWNYICRYENAQIGELPRILEKIIAMKQEAWGKETQSTKEKTR